MHEGGVSLGNGRIVGNVSFGGLRDGKKRGSPSQPHTPAVEVPSQSPSRGKREKARACSRHGDAGSHRDGSAAVSRSKRESVNTGRACFARCRPHQQQFPIICFSVSPHRHQRKKKRKEETNWKNSVKNFAEPM